METSSTASNGSQKSSRFKAEDTIAGNSKALKALRQLIIYPILYHREAQHLGLKWPRGLLLYGPPGTGKTSMVRAVVQECDAHLVVVSPHSVLRGYAGESEKILRDKFSEARSHAKLGKPSVIFFDEIDALCPLSNSRREQDVRVISQLSTLMDSVKSSVPHVVVVASTNRVGAIDPALRRSGRFDFEVEVTTPTEMERLQILKLYTRLLPLDPIVDLQSIAAFCNGYVGADLEALCREATILAQKRSSDTSGCDIFSLRVEDWDRARSKVGPSMTRGVSVEIPKVTWNDIGGLQDLKKKLQQTVEWPIKRSAVYKRLGITPMRGVLLHGPPGCSKTTIVKAAVHAAQASFFSFSCAELYSKYVGQGEALLRDIFQRARRTTPSIIFFDEVDVVATRRVGEESNSSTVGERLLSTLLTEMDGLQEAKGILVLAATNRPHAIDPALMRPGRFDLVLYVPPPDMEARYEILCVHTRKMKLDDDVDLRKIAQDTELFTGAELESLCMEAGCVALRENICEVAVCDRHFQTVKQSLKPALSREEIDAYASFMKKTSSESRSQFEVNENGKGKTSMSYSAFSLKIVVLSLVVLASAKYFMYSKVRHELAST